MELAGRTEGGPLTESRRMGVLGVKCPASEVRMHAAGADEDRLNIRVNGALNLASWPASVKV